ncbi:MAG: KdsC family phosphatase [Candidatus Gastranaerophilaceae bacterium]
MNGFAEYKFAAKAKIAVFDVDGVMTDGSITYDSDGKEYKTFNAKDGQGLVMLNRAGIKTAVITARTSPIVTKRFEELGFTRIYQGQKNKEIALDEMIYEFDLKYDQIAYMGDDLPDICILRKVGISACPSDAVDEVKRVCRFVSSKEGGKGAVRELCDVILKNKIMLSKGSSDENLK